MRSLLRFVFLASAITIGFACSSGTANGGTCTKSSDCSGDVCLTSADFPAGYCTQACNLTDASSCPSGSVCIDDASGAPAGSGLKSVCYQSCTTNTDCTSGYSCKEKAGKLVCKK